MPSLTTILLAAWGITAAGMYGWHQVDKRIAVHEARRLAAVECRENIAKIGKELNDAAERRIADAMGAADAVGPTPADAAELERLCHSDRACRSRPD